ncbi:uncharacterized protein [Clytia hemisphaerica]|uniref:Uncharacterized protein n=1 Tax=Clytia hemisphaerica TaxID=252671 RepID=A0A7M5VAF0_9CNID|eukprot:TCONS_00032443-protein
MKIMDLNNGLIIVYLVSIILGTTVSENLIGQQDGVSNELFTERIRRSATASKVLKNLPLFKRRMFENLFPKLFGDTTENKDSEVLPAIYFETANNDAQRKKEIFPHLFGRSISSSTLPLSYGNDAKSGEKSDAQMPLAYATSSRQGKNFFQSDLPLFKDASIMTPVNNKPWFHSRMKPFAPALRLKLLSSNGLPDTAESILLQNYLKSLNKHSKFTRGLEAGGQRSEDISAMEMRRLNIPPKLGVPTET